MHEKNPFADLSLDSSPLQDPGYLEYWKVRAENFPSDIRVANIVSGLTRVAIRGESGIKAEYTDRSPALQARYWYRSLGPLNPMDDIEPDLIKACSLMYGAPEEGSPQEDANLKLDTVYAISELARVSDDPRIKAMSLRSALESAIAIKSNGNFSEQPAIYRLQTEILLSDIFHSALRFKITGITDPKPLGLDDYRAFEKEFVKLEKKDIETFGRYLESGITNENFGLLFEFYYLIARRHDAWADEQLDTVDIRGASSRENAEWTGEYIENRSDLDKVTGNHDIVIRKNQANGKLSTERIQLKTVEGNRRYHPGVVVLDFHKVMEQRFTNIDNATHKLVTKLRNFRDDYRVDSEF